MTSADISLQFPDHLSQARRDLLTEVAERNAAQHGPGLLGLSLSGSAGRGMATERSDVDVHVILTDEAMGDRETTRSPSVDEIPIPISELRQVPPYGSEAWWFRWTFAWVPVLLDRTSAEELPILLARWATLTQTEADAILTTHDRLDGWINFAYRALKNDRDGRPLETRLDAAESISWLLDVIFALNGRVRPYQKYLPWELREHPLPGWEADELLALLTATLDGDSRAIRTTFLKVSGLCRAYDATRPAPLLGPIIDDWGDELSIFDE